MRKTLLVVWLVSFVGLFCILGYNYLHGSTAGRKSLAEDFGIVWGLSFIAWGVLTLKARQ
jgi:hypothetical protein